jgi:hypothetical protein
MKKTDIKQWKNDKKLSEKISTLLSYINDRLLEKDTFSMKVTRHTDIDPVCYVYKVELSVNSDEPLQYKIGFFKE